MGGWLAGGRLVGSGFCNGCSGWEVGWQVGGWLAADFVTDVADGLTIPHSLFPIPYSPFPKKNVVLFGCLRYPGR
jgi:hypothetical protein